MAVSVKTGEDIARMRECGLRLAVILACLADMARPGVATAELDLMAERLMHEAGGDPLFRGYRMSGVKTAFPASICASVNDEVVHGIPREDRVLKDGDIVGIDIGMRWPASRGGMVTDMAVTVGIGNISPDAKRLIRATRASLDAGIAAARPGATLGDIGAAVGARLREDKLGVIRDLAGHGVGYELHEEPLIPNFGAPGAGLALREGHTLAIEPMATLGSSRIKLDADEWTFRTADGSLAAHFEHTIAVTKDGAEILTQ